MLEKHTYKVTIRLTTKPTITRACAYELRTQCHVGHFLSRGVYSTRWEDENVNAQCAGCNLRQSRGDAEIWHEYEKQLELKYGKGTVERLLQKKHQVIKVNKSFLEDNIKIYKEALEEYKRNLT